VTHIAGDDVKMMGHDVGSDSSNVLYAHISEEVESK